MAADPASGAVWLPENRKNTAVDDLQLEEHVVDHFAKHEITESASLLIRRGFGIITDIGTGPNRNLFVFLANGAICEISQNGCD